MAKQEVVYVDRYEPNYTRKCTGCDQSPTVTALLKGGKKQEMDLCGPCCWNEAYSPWLATVEAAIKAAIKASWRTT